MIEFETGLQPSSFIFTGQQSQRHHHYHRPPPLQRLWIESLLLGSWRLVDVASTSTLQYHDSGLSSFHPSLWSQHIRAYDQPRGLLVRAFRVTRTVSHHLARHHREFHSRAIVPPSSLRLTSFKVLLTFRSFSLTRLGYSTLPTLDCSYEYTYIAWLWLFRKRNTALGRPIASERRRKSNIVSLPSLSSLSRTNPSRTDPLLFFFIPLVDAPRHPFRDWNHRHP